MAQSLWKLTRNTIIFFSFCNFYYKGVNHFGNWHEILSFSFVNFITKELDTITLEIGAQFRATESQANPHDPVPLDCARKLLD